MKSTISIPRELHPSLIIRCLCPFKYCPLLTGYLIIPSLYTLGLSKPLKSLPVYVTRNRDVKFSPIP